jgi:general secretion pathway protein I
MKEFTKRKIFIPVKYQSGFTLIEVIIAIIILSVSLTMIMQLFSGGLRASRSSCDYTRAVVHAKSIMEEILSKSNPAQDSGEFEDGFRWESEVQTYKELEDSNVNLLKIKIIISWLDVGEKEKKLELVSLKAVSEKEEL